MNEYKMYINSQWVDGKEHIDVLNPATEEVLASTPVASTQEIDHAMESARLAQVPWAALTGIERGNVLRRWGDLLAKNTERLGKIITEEQGKPLKDAVGEADFSRKWFYYYAEYDRRIEGEILPTDGADKNEQVWLLREPVGVVVGIVPWNYPLALAIRKIAPALIAGNTIVVKPHEDTPLSLLDFMHLAKEAGVPDGVVNVVTGPGETVGDALVKHPETDLISFTGSAATGRIIMRNAAANVTSVSMELGGKAPFIVMDDCDMDNAVQTAIAARFANCGQACICNERTYVHQPIFDDFLERLIAGVKKNLKSAILSIRIRR